MREPTSEITELINKIKDQCKNCNRNILYFYNDKKYQKKDSQCGIFAIHFIKRMLDGISFIDYLNTPLSDKEMIKYRDKYFVRIE